MSGEVQSVASALGFRRLVQIPSSAWHFETPKKRLNDAHQDLSFFLASEAYADIVTFLLQLNFSMFPTATTNEPPHIQSYPTDRAAATSSYPIIKALETLLQDVSSSVSLFPPDHGPRRFGNISFRRWYEHVEANVSKLLDNHLPREIIGFQSSTLQSTKDELQAYFLGSLGSPQRLDYGTGHELSFLAFLGCLWKLGAFGDSSPPGFSERAIVMGVFDPYFVLVRKLINTYTLEPAGSHGVWGLDDHCFLPYIFGSAQFAAPIGVLDQDFKADKIPQEGSLAGSPQPGDITKQIVIDREKDRNMYFGAIAFINQVKKGPFWEHSRVLYDISGVPAGWAKINKGMLKMYNAEVLSKFPVVQHFPFGSLFSWTKDKNALVVPTGKEQRAATPSISVAGDFTKTQGTTIGPASKSTDIGGQIPPATAAPWAQRGSHAPQSTRSGVVPPVRAPWAERGSKGR